MAVFHLVGYLLFFRAQAEEKMSSPADDGRLRVKSTEAPLIAKVKMGAGTSFRRC